MEKQSRTSDEQIDEKVKDFVGETIEVKLKNGLTVSVTTPTNRWWFEFLIPKQNAIRWQAIDDDVKTQMIKELKQGKISEKLIAKMPMPLVNLLAEFLMYYTKQDKIYVLDKMTLLDDVVVINAWLKVTEVKRVMDFFGEINKQIPIAGLLGIMKAV